VDQIEQDDRVDVLRHTTICALHGEHGLEAVVAEDARTGERRELPAKALFVFIGAQPHTDWLRDEVAADEDGFLIAGRDLAPEALGAYDGEPPLFLETSRPGIFAVGDVHAGSIKRVASAVGEGSMAVRLVHQRLRSPK
jgi:thioredoxin reductase (NADPH)